MKIVNILSFLSVLMFALANYSLVEATSSSTQEYIDLLERTNQQLSLSWTPLNVIIAILTFLVAFATVGLTIGFTVISYKQGKDYQRKIDASLLKSQQYFERMIGNRNKKAKEIEDKFGKIIVEYEEKLKQLSEKPEEQKTEIEEIKKSIQQLRTEKELLSAQAGSISVIPDYNNYNLGGTTCLDIMGQKNHKCTYCGYRFKIDYNPLTMPIGVLGSVANATCPKCGNIDQI